MRPVLSKVAGTLAVTFALSLSAAVGAQAAEAKGQTCLRWVDIDTMSRKAPDTLWAKTRTRGTWEIRFKGRCDYMRFPDNYFIVKLFSRTECVRSIGVLQVNNAPACFIESVTQLPPPKP